MSTSLRSTPIPWTTGELRLARELRRARWSYGRMFQWSPDETGKHSQDSLTETGEEAV